LRLCGASWGSLNRSDVYRRGFVKALDGSEMVKEMSGAKVASGASTVS
jgi:hypothetical protein